MVEQRVQKLEEALRELSLRVQSLEWSLSSDERKSSKNERGVEDKSLADPLQSPSPATTEKNISLENITIRVVRPRSSSVSPSNQAPHSEKVPVHDAAVESAVGGGSLLAYAGMFFFVLAASFFVKLAIESGWLSPVRQIVGTALFGLGLIVAGVNLRSKDHAYAAFLPAAGIVVLFIAVLAGQTIYGFYSPGVGTLLTGVIVLSSIWLFTFFVHDFFLVTAVCGTYLIPLLLYRSVPPMHSAGGYFIFWDLLFIVCALKLEKRHLLHLAAYLAMASWYLLFARTFRHAPDQILQFALFFQSAQFLTFLIGIVGFSFVTRKILTAAEAWALFPLLLFCYVVEYSLLHSLNAEAAPWVALVLGTALLGITEGARQLLKRDSLETSPMIATFFAMVVVHALYLELLPEYLCPWFGLALGGVLILLAKTRFPYARYWTAYIVAGIVPMAEFFRILFADTHAMAVSYMVLNLIAFGLLGAGYFFASGQRNGLILGLAVVQGLRGLDRLGNLIGGSEAHFLTSGLWAAFALSLLFFGHQSRDSNVARLGLGVFSIVALKVLFSDISESSSLIRVVALLVIGALLYLGGLMWRRMSAWEKTVE